ncbi:hypothetical protein [Devosia sp. 1566]|uniref:hypothetical protein n=1 Tax=unclassified Devosia TaxID=196773 RepID=UPI0032B7EF18
MAEVKYEVVEHDGGFAYKVGDVFSEAYPTHELALDAAVAAADRQQLAGDTAAILYQDAKGEWHEELATGEDRPQTEIEDALVDQEPVAAEENAGEGDFVVGTTVVEGKAHSRDESYKGRAPLASPNERQS